MYFKLAIIFTYFIANDAALINVERNDTGKETKVSIFGWTLPSLPKPLKQEPENNTPFFSNLIPSFFRSPSSYDTDDPFLSLPELLTKYGYPNEKYEVVTMDGYILTLYRVAGKNETNLRRHDPVSKSITSVTRSRDPVLLTHGIAASPTDYVFQGPEQGLAYILADHGYDVWILGHRGSPESNQHTSFDSDGLFATSTYWDYSFHEMGIYDLPAAIDHILALTNQPSVTHIGHSQGTPSLLVLLAERPEYNSMLKSHIGYAPAVEMCHFNQPILRMIASLEIFFLYRLFISIIGSFNLTPTMPSVQKILVSLCSPGTLTYPFCLAIFQMMVSYREPFSNMMPMYVGHNPSPSAFKEYVHFSQNINTCGFAKYQPWPWSPRILYNLDNVNIPIYLFSGQNDFIVSPIDSANLERKLGNVKQHNLLPNFGHWDFIIGSSAKDRVYLPTLDILKELHKK